MAGLELLYASVRDQLRGREDAVVCCLHWAIIKQGLQCIGSGDQIPADVSGELKSEMLPAEWNATQDVYVLKYVSSENKAYMMKIIKLENVLMVHFMRMSGEDGDRMGDIMLDVTQLATEDYRTFNNAYTNRSDLESRFLMEVLDPVLKPSVPTPQSRPSGPQGRDPLVEVDPRREPPRADPLRVPPRRPPAPGPEWGEPDSPFSIGRGDLDPFAGGVGGGMVFDPMRPGFPGRRDPSAGLPGRLPPGAVPPGARFDPFGPDLDRSGNPRGGRRPGPDPDHLPPPGFDDMFM